MSPTVRNPAVRPLLRFAGFGPLSCLLLCLRVGGRPLAVRSPPGSRTVSSSLRYVGGSWASSFPAPCACALSTKMPETDQRLLWALAHTNWLRRTSLGLLFASLSRGWWVPLGYWYVQSGTGRGRRASPPLQVRNPARNAVI